MTPPPEFLCGLTNRVMDHPLKDLETGVNYDRQAIFDAMFFADATCPLTGRPLHPSTLHPNLPLEEKIVSWRISQAKQGQQECGEHSTDNIITIAQRDAAKANRGVAPRLNALMEMPSSGTPNRPQGSLSAR